MSGSWLILAALIWVITFEWLRSLTASRRRSTLGLSLAETFGAVAFVALAWLSHLFHFDGTRLLLVLSAGLLGFVIFHLRSMR